MKVAGIIAEYNPFHNGHYYHVQESRSKTNADFVVAVMSGNCVQRGDVSVFDRNARVSAAIENGVDLIVELPAVFALQSAEIFARNAIYILNSLNCVDYLSFGAECDDIVKLTDIASVLSEESAQFKSMLAVKIEQGMSYPAARAQAVREIYGNEYAEILSKPNNILGIEYIKAIIGQNSPIISVVIKRHLVGHDEQKTYDGIASATYIRELIKRNQTPEYLDYIPQQCIGFYENASVHSIDKLQTAIISNLRKMKTEDLALICDVSEGLENRIKKFVFEHDVLTELVDRIKTKRYTHSRIRRIMLNSFFGITQDVQSLTPQYIKILGFNEKGQELLNKIKKNTSLPLVKNTNHIKKLDNPLATKLWQNELLYDSLYELSKKVW